MIKFFRSSLVNCAARSPLDPPPRRRPLEGPRNYPVVVEGTMFGGSTCLRFIIILVARMVIPILESSRIEVAKQVLKHVARSRNCQH